nr:putative ribonuclease H-like domain-containing protein [Tanacetum cinerariifolium]
QRSGDRHQPTSHQSSHRSHSHHNDRHGSDRLGGSDNHRSSNNNYSGSNNSVSQMCDKKNSVLFTDTECLVLSPDFKLPDESQVLLRVPIENNMYNVNLKNIVPSGDLTCVFAKATIDESNLWHRRLGHINFKTINKLVKGNLVKGLPTKVFENNNTCVACKKGKQHRASCKTKPVSSVNQPLFRLHMDLFGPTFVKSLNKKSYCLVIIDDYSRFTWVFFLAIKDETSPILKTFITGLENQLRLKLKNKDRDAAFDGKEHDADTKKPMSTVNVSLSSSAQSGKQDDKTKKKAKGKSLVKSFTRNRDLSADFKDHSDNSSNDVNAVGFKDPGHPNKVYKVGKALYGLHQDPRAWYETLANYLLENGFHRGKIDQTLFIKKQKGDILLVRIYVDDIIFGATNKDLCKSFEKLMKDKFQMSSMGELVFFLGLQVKQKKDGIFISQDKYLAKILKKFGLTEGKSASTPIDTEKPLLKDPNGEDVDVHIYRSMIGSLMYLTSSRPDNMFASNDVTRLQALVDRKKVVITKAAIRDLPDESQVLLRVPKENNMYNVNLKSIVPSGDLTCLFAKATIDESNLCHRRLGHINFKTINKLVKGNLVRGLPTKVFENDNTCVACNNGKQHRASCKTKPVSSVDQPLYMLHMDLFGPTFVKSLNKKSYYLVVTDDYNSIPRTLRQNGIAERKNRTLIETARTMLADSLLPIPFWAEAINTACYVQNRVLVTKPHNKTPYELLHGRTPSIGFMRPFGCPVTILNTLDSFGKFDGNVDEGFLVGYSVNSKVFRVFNSRTRIVQETLHNNDGDAAFDGKEPDFDVKKPESEVIISPSSSARSRKQEDKTKKEAKGKSLVESFLGYRDLSADFEDCSDNRINEVNVAGTTVPTVGQNSLNNTNTFSAAGPLNAAASPTHGKSSFINAS